MTISLTTYGIGEKELRQACLSKTIEIDVLINSPDGELNSCFTLARLLSRWLRSWEALVPAYATGGATLICLGAAKIVMSDRAHLGLMEPGMTSTVLALTRDDTRAGWKRLFLPAAVLTVGPYRSFPCGGP